MQARARALHSDIKRVSASINLILFRQALVNKSYGSKSSLK